MTKQEEIKQILFDNDLTNAWLARKLRMSKQDLGYQLNDAVNFSADLYDRIIAVLKREGFITKESGQCEHLINQTLEINSLIGHSLSILNSSVKKYTDDKVLEFSERKRLIELAERIKDDFNDQIEEIMKVLEGRTPNGK